MKHYVIIKMLKTNIIKIWADYSDTIWDSPIYEVLDYEIDYKTALKKARKFRESEINGCV